MKARKRAGAGKARPARRKSSSGAGSRGSTKAGARVKASAKRVAGVSAAVQAAQEQARALALAIARVGLDHRALNVEIIDVRGKVDYCDYVIVMAGRSDRQVGALVRHIEQTMEQERGARCVSVEGMPRATWVLMDFSDVIVHIFHQDTRGYYDLESLWIDAARVAVDAGP